MEAFSRDELSPVIKTDGVEIWAKESGGMAMLFYRFSKGANLDRYMHGLPNDACSCPHWGYVLRGKLRIHTADGIHDVAAGQAFHVEPGHVPEALEDTEMFEVSPVDEIRRVGAHILQQVSEAQVAAR